jgi:hypothetical protein
MDESMAVVQGNEFTQQFTWSEAEPTVNVQGPSRDSLKAANRGGRPTLSGRLSRPGRYQITIVQKRTVKITINVSRAKPRLETSVWNVLTGKREPMEPPENP